MNEPEPKNDIGLILDKGNWFSSLSESEKLSLIQLGEVKVLREGECLFNRGDAADGLYAVLDGVLRFSGSDTSGKEVNLTFLNAPNWFGEIGVFDGLSRTHQCTAVRATQLLWIRQNRLLGYLETHPVFWKCLALLMAAKTRLALQALEDASILPASNLLAKRLLQLNDSSTESVSGNNVIHIPQEHVGMMLGISRQTTNQILKKFEQQNLISCNYGEIEILDVERLSQQAGIKE